MSHFTIPHTLYTFTFGQDGNSHKSPLRANFVPSLQVIVSAGHPGFTGQDGNSHKSPLRANFVPSLQVIVSAGHPGFTGQDGNSHKSPARLSTVFLSGQSIVSLRHVVVSTL